MRKVDRSKAVPPSLTAINRKKETELDRARRAFNEGRLKDFEFNAYKSADVHLALEHMFHGKCAYCEGFYAMGAPMDVEHFRPKAGVEDVSGNLIHPGYWWLASNWDNLLPSCIDCNRRRHQPMVGGANNEAGIELPYPQAIAAPMIVIRKAGKGNLFPVIGARAESQNDVEENEYRLLVDPCRDDPANHIEFRVGAFALISLAYAIDNNHQLPKGQASIDIYGLNRLGLVQARTHVLRTVELLITIAAEVAEVADEMSDPAIVAVLPAGRAEAIGNRLRQLQIMVLARLSEMAAPHREYSVMVKAALQDFCDWL